MVDKHSGRERKYEEFWDRVKIHEDYTGVWRGKVKKKDVKWGIVTK